MWRPQEWSGFGLAYGTGKGKRCGGGFQRRNGLSQQEGGVCHNSALILGYFGGMNPITHIPKDRKTVRPLRLVLLMGMTMLLFLLILDRYGDVAEAVLGAG